MKLTDTFPGMVYANIAAKGIRNRSQGKFAFDIIGDFEWDVIEYASSRGLGSSFFLLDREAAGKFIAFNGGNLDESISPNDLDRVKRFALEKRDDERLNYITSLMLDLRSFHPHDIRGKGRIVETYGNEALLLAEAFVNGTQANRDLLETILRQAKQEEFRASLTDESKSKVLTSSDPFNEFVHILAHGFGLYCYHNHIKLPTTIDEFEKMVEGGSLIQKAFASENAFLDMCKFLDIPEDLVKSVGRDRLFTLDILERLPLDLRKKIEIFRLLNPDRTFISDQEKAHWMKVWGGKKLDSVAKAMEYEVSPNALVFEELRKIEAANQPTIPVTRVRPITDNEKGVRVVNILARGLISYCINNGISIPTTMREFEEGLVQLSVKDKNLQAAIALIDPIINREFNVELGCPPEVAHLSIKELIPMVDLTHNAELMRAVLLRMHFGTGGNDEILTKRESVFKEIGGNDFSFIGEAFGNRDCQRELVFNEMRRVVEAGEPLYKPSVQIPTFDQVVKMNILAKAIVNNGVPDPFPEVIDAFNDSIIPEVERTIAGDVLLKAVEPGSEENLELFNMVRRMKEHEDFRSKLVPGELATDITLTPEGQQFVNIMAKGIIRFCSSNGISLPETLDEFEKTVVAKARELGADGGIAFSNLESFAELLTWLDVPYPNELATMGQKLFDEVGTRQDFPPDIRSKIEIIKLLGSNPYVLSMQERAYWIRRWGGEKLDCIAQTFQHHDCQRRYVFNEMKRLIDEGFKTE